MQRLRDAGPCVQQYYCEASEVIVFGSMSVGLHRTNSDIDVLCIGEREYKMKSNALDLVVVPVQAINDDAWVQNELATHVASFGTWVVGKPEWTGRARVGQFAVDQKYRRLSRFIDALSKSWFRLNEFFRVKYSVKLCRETQRLILLERGIPIPPTAILDRVRRSPGSSVEVCERLWEISVSVRQSRFTEDLFRRIRACAYLNDHRPRITGGLSRTN